MTTNSLACTTSFQPWGNGSIIHISFFNSISYLTSRINFSVNLYYTGGNIYISLQLSNTLLHLNNGVYLSKITKQFINQIIWCYDDIINYRPEWFILNRYQDQSTQNLITICNIFLSFLNLCRQFRNSERNWTGVVATSNWILSRRLISNMKKIRPILTGIKIFGQ